MLNVVVCVFNLKKSVKISLINPICVPFPVVWRLIDGVISNHPVNTNHLKMFVWEMSVSKRFFSFSKAILFIFQNDSIIFQNDSFRNYSKNKIPTSSSRNKTVISSVTQWSEAICQVLADSLSFKFVQNFKFLRNAKQKDCWSLEIGRAHV